METSTNSDGIGLQLLFREDLQPRRQACELGRHDVASSNEGKEEDAERQVARVLERLRACTPTPTGPARLLYVDVKRLLGQEGADVLAIAARLCGEMGYDATVKKSRARAMPGLFDLSHEFIQVRLEGGGALYVVEPLLRDHFALPRASSRYREVLARVPDVFVGSRAQLRTLVGIMCTEMATNLADTGLSVPPWRKFESVWSRWSNTREEEHEEHTAAVAYAARRNDVAAFTGTWAEMIREREVREHLDRMDSHAAAAASARKWTATDDT